MGKSLDGSVVLSAQQHGSWEREQVAVRDLERRKFRSFHGERHPRSRDPKKIFILGHPDVEDAGLYNRSGRIATRGIRPSRLGSAGSKETYEEEPRLISRRDGCPAGLVLCGFQMCLNASLKGFGGPRQQRNGMLVLLALAFASRSRCNSYELAEQVVTAAHTVDRPTPNISAAPEKFTC